MKRHAGLPPLPFVAFTLLRQKDATEPPGGDLSARSGTESGTSGARTLLLPDPEASETGASTATAWKDQSGGRPSDGWEEDVTTVLWHVAGFEEMTYSKQCVGTTRCAQSRCCSRFFTHSFPCPFDTAFAFRFAFCDWHRYALPSTKELGFSEMSFMRSPKVSAYEQRSLATEAEAVGDMMMSSSYYRYSASECTVRCALLDSSFPFGYAGGRMPVFSLNCSALVACAIGGTMLPQNLRHGPLGESLLASAVSTLRSGLRAAALGCGANDMAGLFFRHFRLGPHEPMGFWELSHVVRKTAKVTEVRGVTGVRCRAFHGNV